jgi:hypothetical protein
MDPNDVPDLVPRTQPDTPTSLVHGSGIPSDFQEAGGRRELIASRAAHALPVPEQQLHAAPGTDSSSIWVSASAAADEVPFSPHLTSDRRLQLDDVVLMCAYAYRKRSGDSAD